MKASDSWITIFSTNSRNRVGVSSSKLVYLLLGNSFPQMVTYIVPCPVISISKTVYAVKGSNI